MFLCYYRRYCEGSIRHVWIYLIFSYSEGNVFINLWRCIHQCLKLLETSTFLKFGSLFYLFLKVNEFCVQSGYLYLMYLTWICIQAEVFCTGATVCWSTKGWTSFYWSLLWQYTEQCIYWQGKEKTVKMAIYYRLCPDLGNFNSDGYVIFTKQGAHFLDWV